MNYRIIKISTAILTLWPSTLHAQDAPRPVEVAKAESIKASSSEFTLTGTVTSPRRANLSARSQGLITKINVDAGSVVKQGDILLQLDQKLAQLDLELIKAEIEQAKISQADAERMVAEVEKLTKTGGFAKSEALTRQAAVRISEANLKQLDARKALQIERIERHKLHAPFDGVISSKISEEGEWVATGTPVLELISMEELRFDLQVPQEFLKRFKDTGHITVTLDAYPNVKLDAKLAAIIPVKNQTSRTFLTRLTLIDPNRIAGPGMSGTASIESRQTGESIVQVPRDAVVRYPDGSTKVWILINKDNRLTVSSRSIKTAGKLGEMAEITEGLQGGEIVILRGNENLQQNQQVEVLPSNNSPKQLTP